MMSVEKRRRMQLKHGQTPIERVRGLDPLVVVAGGAIDDWPDIGGIDEWLDGGGMDG